MHLLLYLLRVGHQADTGQMTQFHLWALVWAELRQHFHIGNSRWWVFFIVYDYYIYAITEFVVTQLPLIGCSVIKVSPLDINYVNLYFFIKEQAKVTGLNIHDLSAVLYHFSVCTTIQFNYTLITSVERHESWSFDVSLFWN